MLTRMLAILTLTGISVFLIGAASAHDADDGERDGRGLVGSWIVMGAAGGERFTTLSTFTKDGAMINAPQSTQTGLGVWRPTGGRQFALKFVELLDPGDPDNALFPPDTSLTISAEVTVSKDGSSASGPFSGVFENPLFGELFRFTGTVAFERITLDDDGDSDSDSD